MCWTGPKGDTVGCATEFLYCTVIDRVPLPLDVVAVIVVVPAPATVPFEPELSKITFWLLELQVAELVTSLPFC